MCAHWVASHLPLCVCQCWLPPQRHPPLRRHTLHLIADAGGKVFSNHGSPPRWRRSNGTLHLVTIVCRLRTLVVSCRSRNRGAAPGHCLSTMPCTCIAPPHACESHSTTRLLPLLPSGTPTVAGGSGEAGRVRGSLVAKWAALTRQQCATDIITTPAARPACPMTLPRPVCRISASATWTRGPCEPAQCASRSRPLCGRVPAHTSA